MLTYADASRTQVRGAARTGGMADDDDEEVSADERLAVLKAALPLARAPHELGISGPLSLLALLVAEYLKAALPLGISGVICICICICIYICMYIHIHKYIYTLESTCASARVPRELGISGTLNLLALLVPEYKY